VLVEAVRGRQVCLAAPGADLPAAGLHGDYVAVRGTSFAAPIVAGLLAAGLPRPDRAAAAAAVTNLVAQAKDLGTHGIDTTYGAGLVGDSVRATLSAAHLKLNKASERDVLE
jgi:subtilisin family serine protease